MFSGFESFLYILIMSVMRCRYINGIAILQKLFVRFCSYGNIIGLAEIAAFVMVNAVNCGNSHA